MEGSGLDLLRLVVPEGADILTTCAAKENRIPVLCAGIGIILLGIAYTKVTWLGPQVQAPDKKVEDPSYDMEELL